MKGWNHVLVGETYVGCGARTGNFGAGGQGAAWVKEDLEDVEEADETDEQAENTESLSESELPEESECCV
jgi:hypothetical protein